MNSAILTKLRIICNEKMLRGTFPFCSMCSKSMLVQCVVSRCPFPIILRNGSSFSLVYKEHGDPRKVISGEDIPVRTTPEAGEVVVSMLASPINPADINMIQGVYPIKPPLPAVGGNEGVCQIEKVGDNVNKFQPGDRAVAAYLGWGTWTQSQVVRAADLVKIDNDVPLAGAATLSVNPCTAYRMLHDFENQEAGDVVIQNGANSGVGQAVIQICKKLGIKTVNIVRNRPDIDKLTSDLSDLGASYIVTDEFVRKPEMKDFMKTLPKPKLALNCVGGKSSAELLKYLDDDSTMVTYGGMSKQPMLVPAGPLIFRNVKLRGYWMTRWNKVNSESDKKKDMWNNLCEMLLEGNLKAPAHKLVPISNFKEAISNAMESLTTQKQIIIMTEKCD